MSEIRLQAIITEDHQLVVQVPETLLPGPVEIMIIPAAVHSQNSATSLTREEARRRLAAAGFLANADTLSIHSENDDHEFEPFVLPLGSLTSDQIIDEDRGLR